MALVLAKTDFEPEVEVESADSTTNLDRYQSAAGLTPGAAQDLLDWLDANGINKHDVTLERDGTMCVSWIA